MTVVQTKIFIEISTHWGPEAYSEPWNIETLTNLEACDTENPGIFRTLAS